MADVARPAPTILSDSRAYAPQEWRVPQFLKDEYELIERLADGGQAHLHLVRPRSQPEAVRKVLKVYFRDGLDPELIEKIRSLDRAYVVDSLPQCRDGASFEIMEYADGGTLRSYLDNGPLSDESTRKLLLKLIGGIEHIAAAGIIHRDIKPENILLRVRDEFGSAILSDWDISSVASATLHATSQARTARYAAPEAIDGMVEREKTDIWSLGICIFEAVSGIHPFANAENAEISSSLRRFSMDDVIKEKVTSETWRTLLRGMLQRDTKQRFNAEMVKLWLSRPGSPQLVRKPDSSTASTKIRFLGSEVATPEDLAQLMAERWDDSVASWDDGQSRVITWLKHDIGNPHLAGKINAIDASAISNPHLELFAILGALAPGRRPTYRGYAMNAKGLSLLTAKARQSSVSYEIARDLVEGRILHMAASMPGAEDSALLRRLDTACQEQATVFQAELEKLRGIVAPALMPSLKDKAGELFASVIQKELKKHAI